MYPLVSYIFSDIQNLPKNYIDNFTAQLQMTFFIFLTVILALTQIHHMTAILFAQTQV